MEHIVSAIAKHYAVLNIKAELDQLICGMSCTLKYLELIREYPKSLKTLFVWSNPPPLTADTLYDLLLVKYSPQGNNQREREEAVIRQWNAVTQFIEGITGCAFFKGVCW